MSEIQKELTTKLEENQERQQKMEKLANYACIAMLVLAPVAIGTLGKAWWCMHKERQLARKMAPFLDVLLEAFKDEA